MGALIFWGVVVVALLLLWFLPGQRPRRWAGRSEAPGGLVSGESVRSEEQVRAVAAHELHDRGTGSQGGLW